MEKRTMKKGPCKNTLRNYKREEPLEKRTTKKSTEEKSAIDKETMEKYRQCRIEPL